MGLARFATGPTARSGSGGGNSGNPLDPRNKNVQIDERHIVKKPNGKILTDIDVLEVTKEGELWLIEEKSAGYANNINDWVKKNIYGKAESYMEAVQGASDLPFAYRSNNIGFRFEDEIWDANFRSAVENAVQDLQTHYPDFNFELFVPD